MRSFDTIRRSLPVLLLLSFNAYGAEVIWVEPGAASHQVPAGASLAVGLDEPVDPESVTADSFRVYSDSRAPISGVFDIGEAEFTFDPDAMFLPGETVQASVSYWITCGGAWVYPHVWQFRTAVSSGYGWLVDSGQRVGEISSYDVALGDLDGDGDLDAFLAAQAPTSRVAFNDGAGGFVLHDQWLGLYTAAAVKLGDVDSDGDLDAFVVYGSGATYHRPNKVFFNDGSGLFSEQGVLLGENHSADAALGDLDGDGDLDALVGNRSPSSGDVVWLNPGNGGFHYFSTSEGSSNSWGVALGDLDGDGDLDVFTADGSGGNRVRFNDGWGTFTDSGQILGSGTSRDVGLGDLDGDGDLDAFVANLGQGNRIWWNDGSGGFADSGQSLGQEQSHSVALGDLDGDGDLDALVINEDNWSRIWVNDGVGIYSALDLPMICDEIGSVALGDLDGDARLDAFVALQWGREERIWLNRERPTPTPSVPVASVSPSNGAHHVPAEGDLEIVLGGAVDPGSADADGWVVRSDLRGRIPGSYMVNGDSVVFDPDGPLLPGERVSTTVTHGITSGGIGAAPEVWWFRGAPAPGGGRFVDAGQSLGDSAGTDVALGDLDGDGDLDALVTSTMGDNRLWLNDGSGGFSDSGQLLDATESRHVVLGDLDGDADLDVVIGNDRQADHVWMNDGTGWMTDSGQALGDADETTSLDLVDLDGDGDLDLFTVQRDYGSTRTWYNNGTGTFEAGDQLFESDECEWAAWGDLDGDGDQDLALAVQGAAQIWLNQGEGQLIDSEQELPAAQFPVVELGDLDGDGDLDLFLAGVRNAQHRIWWNDGTGTFSDSGQSPGEGAWRIELGDLDGDGDLDCLQVFRSSVNQIWLNDSYGQFSDTGQKLGRFDSYGGALGDLDGDGDLDAFTANSTGGHRIWVNRPAIGVSGVSPEPNDASVPPETTITVELEEPLDPGSVGPDSFLVQTGFRGGLEGTFSLATREFSFDPLLDLLPGEPLEARITSGATCGGIEVWPFVWRFRAAVSTTAGRFWDTDQQLGNGSSSAAVLGDLDGDGDLDAFTVNHSGGGPGQPGRIWLNTGDGWFDDSGQSIGTGDGFAAALGDLDGDRDLDLFVANDFSTPNRIWLNDGGIFTDTGQLLGSDSSSGVELGDLDGDGDLDAYVLTWGQYDRILFNAGDGQFQDSLQELGWYEALGIALGDLDGDGDLDAFVANTDWANQVLINGGLGYMDDSGQMLGTWASYDVALGDLDGDGDLDAFVANPDHGNRVWWNDGAGAFTDSGQSLGSDWTVSISLGDLDGDGDLDALAANTGPNRIWLNDGAGDFTDAGYELGGLSTRQMALGDLDGDGDLDAFEAVFGDSPNRIWLHLPDSMTPTPTDSPTPTRTPAPSPTPTVTRTPTLSPTQAPTETATSTLPSPPSPEPSPTVSPSPNPTITHTPCPLGVRIEVPRVVGPGETFFITGHLDNPGPPLEMAAVVFLLNAHGHYWFWPSWTRYDPPVQPEIDSVEYEIPVGSTRVEVVPEMIWPDTGSAQDHWLLIHGAILDPSLTEILGQWATEPFGYGPIRSSPS